MPDNLNQPRMWTLGSGAGGMVACAALAALFIAFFVVCLVRGMGFRAMAFAGAGAALSILWTLTFWRARKRSADDPPA